MLLHRRSYALLHAFNHWMDHNCISCTKVVTSYLSVQICSAASGHLPLWPVSLAGTIACG